MSLADEFAEVNETIEDTARHIHTENDPHPHSDNDEHIKHDNSHNSDNIPAIMHPRAAPTNASLLPSAEVLVYADTPLAKYIQGEAIQRSIPDSALHRMKRCIQRVLYRSVPYRTILYRVTIPCFRRFVLVVVFARCDIHIPLEFVLLALSTSTPHLHINTITVQATNSSIESDIIQVTHEQEQVSSHHIIPQQWNLILLCYHIILFICPCIAIILQYIIRDASYHVSRVWLQQIQRKMHDIQEDGTSSNNKNSPSTSTITNPLSPAHCYTLSYLRLVVLFSYLQVFVILYCFIFTYITFPTLFMLLMLAAAAVYQSRVSQQIHVNNYIHMCGWLRRVMSTHVMLCASFVISCRVMLMLIP